MARDADLERSDFLVRAGEQLERFMATRPAADPASSAASTLIDDDPDYLAVSAGRHVPEPQPRLRRGHAASGSPRPRSSRPAASSSSSTTRPTSSRPSRMRSAMASGLGARATPATGRRRRGPTAPRGPGPVRRGRRPVGGRAARGRRGRATRRARRPRCTSWPSTSRSEASAPRRASSSSSRTPRRR